ncbi:HD domain-containing phosphohydrolase [Hippea sp. KM1]|uniref:HD domain-containing phosphohydrolase n=1 Tax=Hippea sp. KM1 TaxID=944481 RepID=UPI0004B8602B|nr:HD domain-containing phosphohydrolase [Hippea sp. KM1]
MVKLKRALPISFLLSIGLFILTVAVVSAFFVILLKANTDTFNKNLSSIKTEYLELLKRNIKSDVIETQKYIPYLSQKSRSQIEETMKLNCEKALSLSYIVYSSYKAINIKNKKPLNDIILQTLQQITFLDGFGFHGIISNGHLRFGRDAKDEFYLIKPSDTLSNGGFVKLTNGSSNIICYTKRFSPSNSYIASCLFENDLEYLIKTRVAESLANRNISSNKNRYIFINDTSGNVVLIYNSVMLGKNIKLWELAKNKKEEQLMRNVFKKELKAYHSSNGEYINYMWHEPKSRKPSQKISFIIGYKPWRWIIGEGFYEDEMESALLSTRENLKKTFAAIVKKYYLYLFAFFGLMLLFTSALFILINKKLNRVFKNFEIAFRKQKKLNEENYPILELKNIAKYINNSIEKFKEYENEFLEALIYAMESKDPYTKGHSQRVARYASLIAAKLNLNEEEQEELYKAGLLHDIGKIGIPDNILLKPGKLTPNEYRIIQYHPIFSYEIVSKIEQFKPLAEAVRHHHERCDGSGYPDGLTCEQISLKAKILAIADVFDALTSKRRYRDRLSVQDAIAIMKKEPLDKNILSAVEDELSSWCIEESDVEYKMEIIEEVEKIREELFDIDYMTGLKRRKVFIEETNSLIKKKKTFAVFFVDIKNLSIVNHRFSTAMGDKLILYSAIALSEFTKKCSGCSEPSRAYNDAFLFILNLNEKEDCTERCQSITKSIKAFLLKRVKELFERDEEIDNKTKNLIKSHIGFHVFYTVHPDEFKNTEDLIYGCMRKKQMAKKLNRQEAHSL